MFEGDSRLGLGGAAITWATIIRQIDSAVFIVVMIGFVDGGYIFLVVF